MKTISLWQPWCFAITHLGKDIENRTWSTHYRGPLLLHAAKRQPTKAECESFCQLAEDIVGREVLTNQLARAVGPDFRGSFFDALRALPRGGIVAQVEVVDVVSNSSSAWAFDGQFHWQLEHARALAFKAVTGQRGFFDVTP
jgi:hypothetical protein